MLWMFGTCFDNTNALNYVKTCKELLMSVETYEFQGEDLIPVPKEAEIKSILFSCIYAGIEEELFDDLEEFRIIFDNLGDERLQSFIDMT